MQEQREVLERLNGQLKEKILQHTPTTGSQPTAIPGYSLVRRILSNRLCSFFAPFIGLTVQGFKRTIVGKTEYSYGEGNCVVLGMDMPSVSYILVASEETPFLALSLDLERGLAAQLAAEMPSSRNQEVTKSMAVMEADDKLMTAFLRLTDLLDVPDEIPIMAPMLIREIHYRILVGPQGPWLRTICSLGTTSNQVAKAVTWIRNHYKLPLQVEDLAQKVGMSASSLFRNFKQMTTLSPLQFQKTLRLYEAQRLLLTNEYDVANAAYAVGYESSTQFIREYKRMFGEPPHRDVSRKMHLLNN